MKSWLNLRRGQRDPAPASSSDTTLNKLRYAVVDTELTSLDSSSNRVLSIGAIGMDGAKICMGDQFYRVVNPGVNVPAEGILIHKLRPNDVERGEPTAQALTDLQLFIADRVLIGHFVNIDLKALRKELGDEAHKLNNPAIDTARVHRWLLQNGPCREDLIHQLENIDLASLARFYNIEFHEAHHALDDAFVTARLWQNMLHRLERMSIVTLKEVLRIAKAG
jgi:DNA polymerase III subunit epsilon